MFEGIGEMLGRGESKFLGDFADAFLCAFKKQKGGGHARFRFLLLESHVVVFVKKTLRLARAQIDAARKL